MIKKALVFLVIYFAGYGNSYAQRKAGFFNVGFSLFLPWHPPSGDAVALPAFTVEPGLWIFHDEKISLSLSVPISGGATFKSDAFMGIDLPAMISLSYGSATGINAKDKLGFKLGAGAAYINAANNYESVPPDKTHAEFFGYRVNAGICFKGGSSDNVIPALMLSFGKPFASTEAYVIGFGIHLLMIN